MTNILDIRRFFVTLLIILSLPMAFVLTGCESIYDDEGDCSVRYHVAFNYSNNILGVDAFSSKVKSVSLFVYDKQGNLVTTKSEAGDALSRKDYTMTVDVQPGIYDLVAWCGLADGTSFVLNGGAMPGQMTDANAMLQRGHDSEGNAVSDKQLTPLFHAIDTDVDFPDTWGDILVCTMNLTKDTNTIRVILAQYNTAKSLNPDDFTFSITDANGYLAYDNSLLADEPITYTEWTKQSMDTKEDLDQFTGGTTDEETRAGETIDQVSSIIAELDLSRLMAAHRDMRLVINAADKEQPVLSLPIIQLLLYTKGQVNSQMTDQSYLDCQDEYNLVFFINDDNGWNTNAGIYVNNWLIRYQSADF